MPVPNGPGFWTAHLLLYLIWHIDQTEPIEHPVDVGHASNIAQRFWAVYHFSFNILQRQQHRAPRQTFAVFPAVDSEFLCILAVPALFNFVRKWQSGVGF